MTNVATAQKKDAAPMNSILRQYGNDQSLLSVHQGVHSLAYCLSELRVLRFMIFSERIWSGLSVGKHETLTDPHPKRPHLWRAEKLFLSKQFQ